MKFRFALGVVLICGCGVNAPARPSAQPTTIAASESATTEQPRPATEAMLVPESARIALEASEASAPATGLPRECADAAAAICTPASSFVTEICKRKSGDHALALFAKGTPWTRAYVRGDVQAWFAGARLTAPVDLKLDEEVLIVASRGPNGGIMVGGGSYDVMRWDGQCVSLMADEVTLARPPAPFAAPIAWRWLTEETREALLQVPRIKAAHERSRDRCRDDRSAPGCEAAARALSERVTEWVRGGGEVPEPALVMR